MAGRRTFRILTSSQQSGISSKNSNTHIVQQIHIRKITTHTRQQQQHTQHNYNNKHNTTTTIHTLNQQQLHKRKLKTSNKTHETSFTDCKTEFDIMQMKGFSAYRTENRLYIVRSTRKYRVTNRAVRSLDSRVQLFKGKWSQYVPPV